MIMPNYKGHLAGGCVAYGIMLYALSNYDPTPTVAIEWLGCTLAGSLFPDIDTKSKGQKLFYAVILLVLLTLVVKEQFLLFVCISMGSFLPMLVHHRGLFHRLWFILFMAYGLWLAADYYVPHYADTLFYDLVFFVTGAISHIWLDLGLRKMIKF
jgi:membrane-bound metal-dependent hydrolase YbcI (DUF457 family)